MRIVVPAAAILLAGCVQQAYVPPAPIQLQPYGPAIPYRQGPSTYPSRVEPTPAPLPAPTPLETPTPDSGAIPLQDMPAPAAETPSPAPAKPQDAAPAPAVQRQPVSGPGSNVPLEGFRPMHSQTRPTP